MQVVGNSARLYENFNGVSQKLKDELIKKPKQGEVIHLQLLNGSYDPVLQREVFGASKALLLKDRIFDPYAIETDKKDDKGNTVYQGAYVEIGVPETIANNAVAKCKKYWVESIANGIPGNGQFHLNGGSIADMETYEFLCLSNGNPSNPYRAKSVLPKFEVVDAESQLAKDREKDFKEIKAKLARLAMDDPEKAKELSKLIPKEKAQEPPKVTA